jgi:hypothetical protein
MEKTSVEKLLDAGYIFLRPEDSTNTKNAGGVKYVIKKSDSFGVWRRLEEFPTRAARDQRLKELVKDKNQQYLV